MRAPLLGEGGGRGEGLAANQRNTSNGSRQTYTHIHSPSSLHDPAFFLSTIFFLRLICLFFSCLTTQYYYISSFFPLNFSLNIYFTVLAATVSEIRSFSVTVANLARNSPIERFWVALCRKQIISKMGPRRKLNLNYKKSAKIIISPTALVFQLYSCYWTVPSNILFYI